MTIRAIILCLAAMTTASTAYASPYATDGDKAAQFGTRFYNSISQERPLPVSRGEVLQDTARNLGKGESPRDAWSNAAKSNSGQ